MSEQTAIEWCDSTFNPWIGCAKIGPGCDHCYAEHLMDTRMHKVKWGAGNPRVRTSAGNWQKPLQWDRQHDAFFATHGRRQRVFCASLADVFDNEVSVEWRRDLFGLIELTPNLDWLLLTKRIGNVFRLVSEARTHDWLAGRRNVWLGITVVNQEEADRDIPKLLATPGHVRFLSIEPILGPINLTNVAPPFVEGRDWHGIDVLTPHNHSLRPGIDWVICGGESGIFARPTHPDWVRSLRGQCAATGVPFLFKQWGDWRPPQKGEAFDTTMGRAQRVPAFIVAPCGGTAHCFENDQTRNGGTAMLRVGKKTAGRLLDGREWNGYPEATR